MLFFALIHIFLASCKGSEVSEADDSILRSVAMLNL